MYGEYCSKLPAAQEHIEELCNKNEVINQAVLVRSSLYLLNESFFSYFATSAVILVGWGDIFLYTL